MGKKVLRFPSFRSLQTYLGFCDVCGNVARRILLSVDKEGRRKTILVCDKICLAKVKSKQTTPAHKISS